MTQATALESDRELVQERVFDAPRALVFHTFTDPGHLPQWFGPKDFSCSTKAIDVRPGGSWEFTMHGPNGMDFPNFMRFKEIVPNEYLTYDHGETADGAPHFQVTVTFTDEGPGKTRMTMRSLFPSAEDVARVKGFGAVELGAQTLQKLADRMASESLVITRSFDAPVDLVYQAWAEPANFAQWWGPAGMALDIKSMEFKPGGSCHYRLQAGENEMWGLFRYVEIDPGKQIVWINSFSNAEGTVAPPPFPGDFPLEIFNVMTFKAEGDKTTLTLMGGPHHATPEQQAFFNGMKASMQGGFKGTFDQLEAFLAK